MPSWKKATRRRHSRPSKSEEEIPAYNVPYDVGNGALDMAAAYIECGQKAKGEKILQALVKRSREYINWYMALPNHKFAGSCKECFSEISALAAIQQCYEDSGEKEKSEALMQEVNTIYSQFAPRAEALGFQL